jgi:hypothetical protein
MKATKFIIAIDAGLHTGVAVYDCRQRTFDLKTLDFWRCVDFVCSFDPADALIVVEDPAQNKPVFHERLIGKEIPAQLRKAQNVGSNKREARLLIERFRQKGFSVVPIRPKATKWTQEQVRRHTGLNVRTNEHTRDAVRLIYSIL